MYSPEKIQELREEGVNFFRGAILALVPCAVIWGILITILSYWLS